MGKTASDNNNYSDYICPQKHSTLKLEAFNLLCEDCGHIYKIIKGIPNFLSGEPIENSQTRLTLARLNQIAQEKNWHDALLEIYSSDPSLFNYVTNADRAHFLDLLNLNKDSIVLEIGPGLGQFTPLIASRSKQVYALEVVAGQAEFVDNRCRQEGLINVRVACGGDDCRLPYPDSSMDTVILNLVLEWCSTRNHNEPSTKGQERMLDEMFRVLKPGGNLYLSTKNRYALRYIIGKTDEHSYDMKFGNALPRWMHYILLRLNGHKKPRGVLHSLNHLRSMLLKAGYIKPSSFWATPEMRYPKYYVPTNSASIRKARSMPDFPQGDIRSVKALMSFLPAGMVKHFTPGLTFIAFKPPA